MDNNDLRIKYDPKDVLSLIITACRKSRVRPTLIKLITRVQKNVQSQLISTFPDLNFDIDMATDVYDVSLFQMFFCIKRGDTLLKELCYDELIVAFMFPDHIEHLQPVSEELLTSTLFDRICNKVRLLTQTT